MTVMELIKMLEEVDGDLPVMIYQPSQIGDWLFAEACEAESGLTEFHQDENDTEHNHTPAAFCLIPHGITEHDEEEESDEIIPEMN